MKKLLVVVGLIFAFAGMSHAGVALDQGAQPASYGTSIVGSSATIVGSNLSVALAPGSVQGTACRNCFTKFIIQESTATIFSVLDGATTVYTIDGVGLGASGVNTHTITEEHLGPVCFGNGNTTTLNTVTTGGTGIHTVINYEGYTFCGVSRNANN